jgi:hypothetical protein
MRQEFSTIRSDAGLPEAEGDLIVVVHDSAVGGDDEGSEADAA